MTDVQSFIIEDSARKKLMDQKNIFGQNFVEMLAEIITNADDSYSRIEDNTGDYSPKKIDIYFDRRKDEFTVVDFAEGIGENELIKIFRKYADDTSNTNATNKVRGMFGRGATDVMIESSLVGKENFLISFRDDESTRLVFKFDENNNKTFTRDTLTEEEIRFFRNEYNITENGTIVRFGTGRKYPKDVIGAIEDYYMLRFIFDNENRKIMFHDLNEETEKQLQNDMSYFDYCDVLCEESFDIKYKNYKLKANLKIVNNPNKISNHYILIYDEKKAVYDDSNFNRATEAGIDKIEGRLEIINLTTFAKQMMNEFGETIITPTRDGFEMKNDFYKDLKNKVDKYIINACAMVSQSTEKSQSGLRDRKEWRNFFKDINKYFKDELDTIIDGGEGDTIKKPPEEGIKFARNSIPVKIGKHYLIKLLINPNLIILGSLIQIQHEGEYITLAQDKIIFTNNGGEEVPSVLVDILGLENTPEQQFITAHCGIYEANLYYDVRDEEVHLPAYGFDFFPNELRKKPEVTRTATMYVDTNKFEIGSIIEIENNNSEIELEYENIVISTEQLVNDNIAKISLNISGGILGKTYYISAILNARKIEFPIIVQEKDDTTNNKTGIINDILPKESPVNYVQSYYDNDRNIIIVSNNVANKQQISTWLEKKEYATIAEKFAFYSILSEELARIMIREKSRKDKIAISSDPDEFFRVISEEKDKMYKMLLKSFEE